MFHWTKQNSQMFRCLRNRPTSITQQTYTNLGNIETAEFLRLNILTSEVLLPTPGSSIHHRKIHTSKLRINMIFTAPVGSVAETAETKFLDFATQMDGSLAFDSSWGKWQHSWWPAQFNFLAHYFSKMFYRERKCSTLAKLQLDLSHQQLCLHI